MSRKDNEIDLDKFISHDAETNIGQCLVPECHTVFIGKKKIAIKRHYRIAHCMNIEEIDNTEQTIQIHNNAERGESNPPVLYSIKYLNDNPKGKNNKSNNNDQQQDSLEEDKGYRTFLVADYVEYNKETNISKCLIKNCERPMSGRRTGNIKRHYHKVHNFVIVHDNQETICAIDKELSEYYNNDTFGDSRMEEEEIEEDEEEMSEATEQPPVNFDLYIDYDPLINKSLCKVPGCKAYLVGKKPFSIKRHYGLVHNYDIESNGTKLFDKSKYSLINNGHLLNTSIIAVDDLVAYDIKSASFQCLFINCNHILVKHLPSIKKHYHENHKIIIARDSCNIPQRFYRKRKHRDMQYPYDREFATEDGDFRYGTESSSGLIKNELLSEDEQVAHCSKRPNKNLTDYMKEMASCSIKKENNNNNKLKEMLEKPNKVYNIREKSTKIEITLTKQSFFKLCLGLVIERDVSIKLFDDDKYFKPILAPYEQVFDFNINGTVIEDLLNKANTIIVADLRKTFTNKIVCLELHMVKRDNNYYMIINIRFLEEQTICNKLIGFLPINETTKTLPIAECLSKFNIDEQQVYMKTIMAGLQKDEEIYKICNQICKHNPDIKHHPIYDLQIILRTFVEKYSEDIKTWQVLSEYQENSTKDMLTNLKEFTQYLENWSKSDINLQKAKYFFKALQIFLNFMEKLGGAQYVAGDLYRDCLCCELELKGELTKNNNIYAGELYEELSVIKNSLLESSEFIAALYLDARFNFLGSRLLSDAQKSKGQLFLSALWEKFNNYLKSANIGLDPLINDDSNDDDEYALLTQHINDTMPLKSSLCMQDKLTNCVPTKREPFSLDILKYWHSNRQFMEDINELTKIVFTHSASQYILKYLPTDFAVFREDSNKFDRFLMKFNQNILDKNSLGIFENFN
ncbi:uncharacterized protein LOC135955698 [Calliphora vicina]|uniref:uncharacterized protein LOC135955698 n=1 Tax=Calliphora vicina TaxID=7373 RepID=UPI00325ADDEB